MLNFNPLGAVAGRSERKLVIRKNSNKNTIANIQWLMSLFRFLLNTQRMNLKVYFYDEILWNNCFSRPSITDRGRLNQHCSCYC